MAVSERSRPDPGAARDLLGPGRRPRPGHGRDARGQRGGLGGEVARPGAGRPADLAAPLAAVLDTAAGRDPGGRGPPVARRGSGRLLRARADRSGGYYMNLKIRKRIGYPGQGKRPPFSDEAEYDLRDGLLDPVLERGPSTRPRPRRPIRSNRQRRSPSRSQGTATRPTSSSSAPGPAAPSRRATWPRRGSRSSASSRAGGRTRPTSRATSSRGARRRRALQPEPEHPQASRRLPARGLAP